MDFLHVLVKTTPDVQDGAPNTPVRVIKRLSTEAASTEVTSLVFPTVVFHLERVESVGVNINKAN
jgi:hypothetical protein